MFNENNDADRIAYNYSPLEIITDLVRESLPPTGLDIEVRMEVSLR